MVLRQKSPCWRLRFLPSRDGTEQDGTTFIHHRLDTHRDAGRIASWVETIYEPELHAFGGAEAMDVVPRLPAGHGRADATPHRGEQAGQRLARDHPRVHLRPALAHHGFHLYDADAVHVATMSATALLSDRDDVTTYAELFQRLLALAVFGDDARAVLDRLAETHRRNGAAG